MVAENLTGTAAARAKVTVEGPNGVGRRTLWTDSTGQFAFPGLAGGVYFLTAEKTGYAPAYFGQRGTAGRGSPIALDERSEFFASVRLRRLAAVSGRVVDENGAGIPGVTVHAYRQGPPVRAVAYGVSDDRGDYRIGGLKAGRYWIRTGTKQLEDGSGLLPTYYGNSVSASQAPLVTAELDGERRDLEIAPRSGRLSSLTVIVSGSVAGTVTLQNEVTRRSGGVGPGAPARFEELEPGAYTIRVEAQAESRRLSAYREVVLARESESVTVDLAASPTLELRCRAPGGRAAGEGAVSGFLRPAGEPEGAPMERVTCGQTVQVAPGEWDLALRVQLTHFVASATNVRPGEQTYRVRLAPAQTLAVEVVVRDAPASVEGKVVTRDGVAAMGAPVVLRAQGDLLIRMGGERRVEADEGGKFRFEGLPPGRYEVYSSFGAGGEEEGGVVPRQVVVVEEGEKKILEIRLQEG